MCLLFDNFEQIHHQNVIKIYKQERKQWQLTLALYIHFSKTFKLIDRAKHDVQFGTFFVQGFKPQNILII